MLDPTKQYQQGEAEGLGIFNVTNGDIKNVNGRAARISVNNNGTRSATDLGDWGSYQNQQSLDKQSADNAASASALAATQKANLDTQFQNDKQAVGDYTNKFQSDATNTNNAVMGKYHIPDLVSATNGIDQAIKNLQFNSNGGGAQGVMSQSGMDSYLNNTQLPKFAALSDSLSRASTAAQGEYGNLMAPDIAEGGLLNTRIASEMTGFSAQQKNELDALVAKMQAGASLTSSQLQYMGQLATAEKNYEGYLAQANAQVKAAQVDNQYKILPSGNTAINTWNPYSTPFTAP